MEEIMYIDYTQSLEDISAKLNNITAVDYTQSLEDISAKLNNIEGSLHLIITFLFIFMIVIVCKFAYRHFNMFFS